MRKKIIPFVLIIILTIIIGNIVLKYMYPLKYYNTVSKISSEYSVDPLIIISIIKAESDFNERATSKKGAVGLMQIRKDTASWCAKKMGMVNFTPDALYDAEVNIRIGIWYYNYLNDHFKGNNIAAVAAYNAGMGNVNKWFPEKDYSFSEQEMLKKIPFIETRRYITKVMNNYKIYNFLYNL